MKFRNATVEEIVAQAETVAIQFACYQMAGELFDECYLVGETIQPESGRWDLPRALSSLNASQRSWEIESETLMEMFPSIRHEFPKIRKQTLSVIARVKP